MTDLDEAGQTAGINHHKPPAEWPCHCCSCRYPDTGQVLDHRCHVHGDHGRRGCVKHGIKPVDCDCGAPVDHKAEAAFHAEYVARGERWTQAQLFAGPVPIRTDTTPAEAKALADSKTRAAAEQAEAQQAALQPLIQAAVDAALAAREVSS